MGNTDAVEVMLEEYKAIRDEVGRSLSNRITILGLGLAALGAILGLTSTELKSTTPPEINTLVALSVGFIVPGIAILVLVLWASEVQRTRRASYHLWGIERRINDRLGAYILQWEEELRPLQSNQSKNEGNALQTKKRTKKLMSVFREHYYAVLIFFSSTAISFGYLGSRLILSKWWTVAFMIFILLFLGLVWYWIISLRRFDYESNLSDWPGSKRLDYRPKYK